MLYGSMVFFVLALVAGLFGFWGLAGVTATSAKALFFFFLAAFIATLVMNALKRRKKRPS